MEIRRAGAQGELLLFETTHATSGHAMPFTRAIEEAKRQISEEHEDRFVYAIDIRQARGRGIQPLSSIARDTGNASAAPDSSRAAPPLDEHRVCRRSMPSWWPKKTRSEERRV